MIMGVSMLFLPREINWKWSDSSGRAKERFARLPPLDDDTGCFHAPPSKIDNAKRLRIGQFFPDKQFIPDRSKRFVPNGSLDRFVPDRSDRHSGAGTGNEDIYIVSKTTTIIL